MAVKTKSSRSMLNWQYRTLLGELSQVTFHSVDEDCPCNQVDLDPPEFCLAKHLLNVSSLAAETSLMDESNREMLEELIGEAMEYHDQAKTIYCKGGVWPDLAKWSRDWRKRIEPLYYNCGVGASMSQGAQMIYMAQKQPTVRISGKCEDKTCAIKVKAAETATRESGVSDLAVSIDAVIRELEEKRKPRGTPKTFALGVNQLSRYEFEYKTVEAGRITASHNETTFELDPNYPPELQPRLRGRAANRSQVQQMAANLDPGALLNEFHSIDRGAPIVGKDMAVESGNGRVMAIKLAISEHPDVYNRYREALIKKALQYGLTVKAIEKMKHPVLVRVRLTDIDRRTFVEEANASTVLTPSAIEVARSDSRKITPSMVSFLEVTEAESIEDALRSPRNGEFVSKFLSKLSATDRGQISDAKGQLNQDGIRRIVMALFVATFPGDTGLRLAEKFFESTDVNVRNVFNGLLGALGRLIEAETLARAGEREPDLAIGEDIANTVVIFSDIKKTPGITVNKYLAQMPMFEKQLTDFQEKLLKILDDNSRSGKKIASLFKAYAEIVIRSPHPKQAALMPDGRLTKEQALDQAVKMMEQPVLMQTPLWCSGIRKTKKDIDSLYRRLGLMKSKINQARNNLEVPLSICSGQAEMFSADASLKQLAQFVGGFAGGVGSGVGATVAKWLGDRALKKKKIGGDGGSPGIEGDATAGGNNDYGDLLSQQAGADPLMAKIVSQICPAGACVSQTYRFFPAYARKRLPKLGGTEGQQDPVVQVKFFTPWSDWTWYALEFDGSDTFFGWVVGFEKELGYFSLQELEGVRGPWGLRIERDIHFEPTPLSKVMTEHGDYATYEAIYLKQVRHLPVCTGSQAKKLERCIIKVKEKISETGYRSNPYAICRASIGCKPGGVPENMS